MKIAMDMLCRVFSRALNIIEKEQLGVSEHHCKRAAALCLAMGRNMGYDDDTLSALATCALFHDNALTEYNISEQDLMHNSGNAAMHCTKGQENVSWLPLNKNADGFILYHHEREDGSGPFGKRAGEYPFEAALLAAADSVDATYRLAEFPGNRLPQLRDALASDAGRYSTVSAVKVLLDTLDDCLLESLRDENIDRTLNGIMPRWELDVTSDTVMGIAAFIAHIIDFKSNFTRKHTSQIANRSWLMGTSYGYKTDELAALYLAASLHDIGKIATPTEVLEKPGKLDRDEFEIIKKHVWYTHEWLSEMPDFELIRNWAADHHEKLDGTGYSFGKTADQLDFNARLMTCTDIYQAVCEPRPYHDARSHADTMKIMYGMAGNGFIDGQIVRDYDEVMEKYSMQDVPAPFSS